MADLSDMDFIPECFVDTNIVESLLNMYGQYTSGVNHQKGCNKVVGTMKNDKYNDNFVLGIIDDDKTCPEYISEFNMIGNSTHLTLLKHKYKHHYIILIRKAMEDFILSCADEIGIDMSDYGLSHDLESFKNVTKKLSSKKDSRFKKLFKDIKDSKEMQIFGNILCYLKTHKYYCKDNELKDFF